MSVKYDKKQQPGTSGSGAAAAGLGRALFFIRNGPGPGLARTVVITRTGIGAAGTLPFAC